MDTRLMSACFIAYFLFTASHAHAVTSHAQGAATDVRWSSVTQSGSLTFGFSRATSADTEIVHDASARPAALMRAEGTQLLQQQPEIIQRPNVDVAGSRQLIQHASTDSHGDPEFVKISSAGSAPAPPSPSTTAVFTATAEPPGDATPHPLWAAFIVGFMCLALCVANSFYQTKKKNDEGAPLAAEGGSQSSPAAAPVATSAAGEKAKKDTDEDSDDETLDTEDLSEDTYGMAIACVVRDMQHLASDMCTHRGVRTLRICASLKLLILNMSIQLFLIVCIADFSCAKAVFDIRDGYSKFEKHMYNNHVYLTGHDNYRGIDDKYFNATLFNSLDADVQGSSCRIPFSQPTFLFLILLIWSFMVIGEIRQTVELFERLILNTESTDNMINATVKNPREDEQEVIMRLTAWVKVLFTFVIIIPRMIIACLLLWLGCRWLTATTDFQNLVLNSVGLEFLLLTKELLFISLVPSRTKRDTRRMKINVSHEATKPNPSAFLGTFLWGFIAAFWVYVYFCYQQVLPEYRWDVREVCVEWMKANYAGWS